jgi:hypothetical protein
MDKGDYQALSEEVIMSSSQTPITDALKKLLAEVNADTGETNWELIMDVVKEKADSGDARFAKLLERAKAVQDANPEYTRGEQAAKG